ncbi:MAG: hypothetical protein JST39_18080 [Bacteroidetes bacterium]|nr:hypothetical protein [Bacteroidota bacterium]
MKPYRNLQGDSGVLAWESGNNYIAIRFRSGEVYLYTDEVTGSRHVARMKKLAAEGKGLSTYISRYVKNKFESKRV